MVSLETYAKVPLAQAFEVHRQAFVGGAKVRARSVYMRGETASSGLMSILPTQNTEILLQFV
jgi:hypothetical protein